MRNGAGEVAAAEQQVQAAESQKRQAIDWISEHEPDRSLTGSLPEIATQLKDLETTRKDLANDRTRSMALAAAARQQADKIAVAAKGVEEAGGLLQRRVSEQAAAAQKLEGLLRGKTLEAREKETDELRAQVEVLGQLILLEESTRDKRLAIEANRNRLGECKLKVNQAQQAAVEARAKKEIAERQLALRQDHLHRAKLVASLEEHRAALKPGEACPLCGATEHPLAAPDQVIISEDTLQAEVRRAREELASAEASWRKADHVVTELNAGFAHLTQTLVGDAAELEATRKRAEDLAAGSDIAVRGLEALHLLKGQKATLVETLRQECGRIRQAVQAVNQMETARLQAENRSQLAKQAHLAAEALLAEYQTQVRQQAETKATLDRRLTATLESLAGLLQPYRLPPPEAGRERAALEQLTARRSQFQAREESLRQATVSLDAAGHRLESAKQALAALEQRTQPLREEARLHSDEVKALGSSPRAGLTAKWSSLEEAEQTVRSGAGALAGAEATAAQRKLEFERAAAASQEAIARMNTRLAGSAFPSATALRAARLAPGESDRIERLEQELRRDTEAVQVRLTEVRRPNPRTPRGQDHRGRRGPGIGGTAAGASKLHRETRGRHPSQSRCPPARPGGARAPSYPRGGPGAGPSAGAGLATPPRAHWLSRRPEIPALRPGDFPGRAGRACQSAPGSPDGPLPDAAKSRSGTGVGD